MWYTNMHKMDKISSEHIVQTFSKIMISNWYCSRHPSRGQIPFSEKHDSEWDHLCSYQEDESYPVLRDHVQKAIIDCFNETNN